MSKIKVTKNISTDVLIIGGGGAGIYAAVEAVRGGTKVLIVSKGKAGNSGNTIMIGGSYSMDGYSAKHTYGFEQADDSLTKNVLREQMIKQGFFLSEQDVVDEYVEDSPACVYELNQWVERAGHKQFFMAPGGWLLTGHAMGCGLLQGLKENPGAEILNDVMIVELLKSDRAVTGAVGIDIYTGEAIVIEAKAVVIATGGYQPFSIKSTNSDMTGDGMAIAYRAGAALADMEFHLPCTTALEPEIQKGSLTPFMFEVLSGHPISLKDKFGKSVEIPEEMQKVAEGSELDKLITTYYVSQAIAEGRCFENGGMNYDLSGFSKEEFEALFERYIKFMSMFYRKGYYHGDSIEEYRQRIVDNGMRIKIAPIYEYTMGGIMISKDMETTVPGLYAAGEAGSGAFGACRIADATTEMLVQGYKAGQSAASYAKGCEARAYDPAQVEAVLEKISRPLGRTDGISGIAAIKRIEKAADEGFGINRSSEKLEKAIRELDNLAMDMEYLAVKCAGTKYNYDWLRALQAENLLTCTLAGVKAADMRKESRGFHMRSDYQQVDNDNWAVRITETFKNGNMEFDTKRAKVTHYEIPAGKDASIPAFITHNDLCFKNVSIENR